MCRYLFKINWYRDNSTFWGNFTVLKNCSAQQVINKTRTTKYEENSASRFGNNYLANHLVKFLQDRIKPWEVELLD